ncbi:MAG: DUF4236 domain-containing protein [Treponema sp.]|nr:DUF4236 domain-containing protein [Treponema sp.]
MGFSFRKSVKIGPVRVNVSKSGVGVSAGVKGARVGINSKGKVYGSAGVKGFQYRTQFGTQAGAKNPEEAEILMQPSEKIETPVMLLSWGIVVLGAAFVIHFGFPRAGIFGAVIGGLCIVASIICAVAKKKREEKTDDEQIVADDGSYSDTIRTHIIQDSRLLPEELDSLMTEFCEIKKVPLADKVRVISELKQERADFLKRKGLEK